MGGWQTVYMSTFFGFAGSTFGLYYGASLVPFKTPVMSTTGLASVGRNAL